MSDVPTIVAVLRWLGSGWLEHPHDVDWVRETAEKLQMEADQGLGESMCCPLCAEVVCDDGCPLYENRKQAGAWREP